VRAVFRQPGFGLLFSGLVASMLGDSLMLIVLAVWVKDLTGSNAAAGMTFFCMALPTLLAPLVGIYVDRVRRRPFLIGGNLASAVAMLPLLLVRDGGDVWIIYSVAFCYGISMVALAAALNGLLKELLPEEMLVQANGSLATVKEGMRLVGPLAGAGLYAWLGGGVVATIDALTFLVAAAAIALLGVREARPERSDEHYWDELMAGIRHIKSDRVLTHTLLALGGSLLVVGFMESAVFAMVEEFGKPASHVGVVVSVQGVGAVLGGITSARLIRRLGEVRALTLSLVVLALGLAVCAASSNLTVVYAGVVVLGFALPIFLVAFLTLLQLRTPQRLMGRVSTAAEVVLGTPQSLSIALGALLVSVISYRAIYWICAAVILLAAGYLHGMLRHHRDVPAPPDAVAEAAVEAPS
jgi:MFS family permease